MSGKINLIFLHLTTTIFLAYPASVTRSTLQTRKHDIAENERYQTDPYQETCQEDENQDYSLFSGEELRKMGDAYAEHLETPGFAREAFITYKWAVAKGDLDAELKLRDCYRKGIGTSQDFKKADLMDKIACEHALKIAIEKNKIQQTVQAAPSSALQQTSNHTEIPQIASSPQTTTAAQAQENTPSIQQDMALSSHSEENILHADSIMGEVWNSSSATNSSSTGTGSSSNVSVSNIPTLSFTREMQASLPFPASTNQPLSESLQKNVLASCPERIHQIIAMWDKSREGKVPKNEKLDEYYTTVPKNWLFLGPPGTGKTTIAKAIAKACGISSEFYVASDIPDQYQNSGTKNLEVIFKRAAARKEPCVIVIDELEAFFKNHENPRGTEANTLTQFWTLLDKYREEPILVIATLNDLSKAPQQLRSRFGGYIIEFSLPDQALRESILYFHMQRLCKFAPPSDAKTNEAKNAKETEDAKKARIDKEKQDKIDQEKAQKTLIKFLAQKTKGYSHRTLEHLVQIAREKYVTIDALTISPTKEDFVKALVEVEKFNNLSKKSFWKRWGPTIKQFGIPTATFVAGYLVSLQQQNNAERLHNEALEQQKKQADQSWWLQIGSLGLSAASAVASFFKKS